VGSIPIFGEQAAQSRATTPRRQAKNQLSTPGYARDELKSTIFLPGKMEAKSFSERLGSSFMRKELGRKLTHQFLVAGVM
jgi:hypothetical protein